MPARFVAVLIAGAVLALGAACGGTAMRSLRIGVLVDCYGYFSSAHEPATASAELPLLERGAKLRGPNPTDGIGRVEVDGRPVELREGCVSGNDEVIPEARRLVEEDGAAVVIGLPNPEQGMVLSQYARRRPEATFLIQPSDAPELTLANPAPNVFRFTPDAAQGAAGLGNYAYRKLGWRTAVTIGDDVPYGWETVSGFVAEFCALGGRVLDRFWAGADPHVPASVDGVYLGTIPALGPFTLRFLKQYSRSHPDLGRHVVGNAAQLFFPQVIALAKGVVFGGSVPGEFTPAMAGYIASFKRAFPRLPPVGALDPLAMPYRDAVEAVVEALEQTHGDTGRGFRAALARVVLESPTGKIRLDRDRQAVVSNYLSEVASDASGKPVVRTLRVVPNVEQTFGGYFTPQSTPRTRKSPACHKGTPPPWAR